MERPSLGALGAPPVRGPPSGGLMGGAGAGIVGTVLEGGWIGGFSAGWEGLVKASAIGPSTITPKACLRESERHIQVGAPRPEGERFESCSATAS